MWIASFWGWARGVNLKSHTWGVRTGVCAILVAVAVAASGQTGSVSDPDKTGAPQIVTPPQVFVTVTKHEMGWDLVQVTAIDPNYSPALLQLQCGLIGKFSNGNARGINVTTADVGGGSNGKVIRATFGCDNLIDRANHRLNIDAIAKGFMGSAKPMVTSLVVQFAGEKAGGETLQNYSDRQVIVEGKAFSNPDGIEYRLELLTQDTRLLKIPGNLSEVPAPEKTAAKAPAMNPLVVPILGAGALAAGALVYFALLKPGHPKRKK